MVGGKPKDILNVFKKSKIVDAVCASSIFYNQYGYSDIKNFLFENHINVRKE